MKKQNNISDPISESFEFISDPTSDILLMVEGEMILDPIENNSNIENVIVDPASDIVNLYTNW